MSRLAIACLLAIACGRAQGVADEDLGDLVVAPKTEQAPVQVARAATDVAELSRALLQPFGTVVAALGPHTTQMAGTQVLEEAGAKVSELAEQTTIELGDKGAYHGLYTNSADYGREVTFDGTQMFLRPRYQRWHGRAPETPAEPAEQRDRFYGPIAATWELLAPGAELIDKGDATVAGRAGRKIVIQKAPKPAPNPPEALVQRTWREARVIEEVSGEVVLDAEKGVPLSVKLAGTISFMRDGRRFHLKTGLTSEVRSLGAAAIAPPPAAEVVATPERLREVDDRDTLLHGIAPPQRKQGPAAGSATP